MEAEQSAQLTGTNRSIGLDRRRLPKKRRNGGTNLPPETARVQRQNPLSPHQQGERPRRPQDTSLTPVTLQMPPPPVPARASAWLEPGASFTGARLCRPGGHSEGPNTRSHPELGRENPQRQWYCRSSGGRVGRRQARMPQTLSPSRTDGRTIDAGWSSPVARQAHNLKVVGSNPTPATRHKPLILRLDQGRLLSGSCHLATAVEATWKH